MSRRPGTSGGDTGSVGSSIRDRHREFVSCRRGRKNERSASCIGDRGRSGDGSGRSVGDAAFDARHIAFRRMHSDVGYLGERLRSPARAIGHPRRTSGYRLSLRVTIGSGDDARVVRFRRRPISRFERVAVGVRRVPTGRVQLVVADGLGADRGVDGSRSCRSGSGSRGVFFHQSFPAERSARRGWRDVGHERCLGGTKSSAGTGTTWLRYRNLSRLRRLSTIRARGCRRSSWRLR